MRPVLVLMLVSAVRASPVAADSCAPRDFTARLGPVHTQDLNTCYAHAVADALGFASGTKVSPQSVIFRYLQTRGTGEGVVMNLLGLFAGKFQGGIGGTALRAAQTRPVCTVAEIGDVRLRERDWLRALELHDELRATFAPRPPEHLIGELSVSVRRIFTRAPDELVRRSLTPARTFEHFAGAIMDERCHELKDRFAGYEVRGDDFHPDAGRALVDIDQALDAEQVPVVHLDQELFEDIGPVFPKALPGLHVVSIAARRPVEGTCAYLVRNSWGSDCEEYPDALRARCDRGNFWFTADELRRYVKSTSWLKPK